MTDRRQELADAATDYVLEHGLIGLTLRPLAAAIGTSDRMLLYHFRDKDDLVATVLRVASDQAVAEVAALPVVPGVRAAVLALWEASSDGLLERCQRLYVQAAALGLRCHHGSRSGIGNSCTWATSRFAPGFSGRSR